jgi:hypothetical protein
MVAIRDLHSDCHIGITPAKYVQAIRTAFTNHCALRATNDFSNQASLACVGFGEKRDRIQESTRHVILFACAQKTSPTTGQDTQGPRCGRESTSIPHHQHFLVTGRQEPPNMPIHDGVHGMTRRTVISRGKPKLATQGEYAKVLSGTVAVERP